MIETIWMGRRERRSAQRESRSYLPDVEERRCHRVYRIDGGRKHIRNKQCSKSLNKPGT
jgi:hypothetical protein